MHNSYSIWLLGLVACGGGSSPGAPSQRVLIAGVEPPSGAVDAALRGTLSIAFVEAIDPASPLDECVSVVDRRGPVAVTVRLDADPTRLLVAPDRDLVLDSAVTATVSTELRTVTGAHLSSPFTWTFTSRPGRWHDTGTLWQPFSYGRLGPQTSSGLAFAIDDEDKLWALVDADHGWQPAGSGPGTGDARSNLIYLGLENDTTLLAGFQGQTPANSTTARGYVRRGLGFKDWQELQAVGESDDFLGYPSVGIGQAATGELLVYTMSRQWWSGGFSSSWVGIPDSRGSFRMLEYDSAFYPNLWRGSAGQHGGGHASIVLHRKDTREVDYEYLDANKGGARVRTTLASGLPQEQVTALDVIAHVDGRAKVLIARSDAPGPRLEVWTFQDGVPVGTAATLWNGTVLGSSLYLAQARHGSAIVTFTGPKASPSGREQWALYYDASRDTWSEPHSLGVSADTAFSYMFPCIAAHGDAALFVSTAASRTSDGTMSLIRYQSGVGFRAPESVAGIRTNPPPHVHRATIDDHGRMTVLWLLDSDQHLPHTLRYE